LHSPLGLAAEASGLPPFPNQCPYCNHSDLRHNSLLVFKG
jgi:hypothetical protein